MRSTSLLMMLLTACGGPTPQEGETEATGGATYTRASDEEPEPVPDEQGDGMWVRIVAEGTGDFDLPSADCPTDLGSDFTSLYEGEATIEDGVYLAAFSESEATLETPSGCAISELTGAVYTSVAVRGELVATTESCQSYCEGWASAEAEAVCEGDADEASCRAAEETTLAASCEQECTTTTHVIVAQTSLGASALTELNASALSGAALGTLEVDLSFDRMEDESGNAVDPGS